MSQTLVSPTVDLAPAPQTMVQAPTSPASAPPPVSHRVRTRPDATAPAAAASAVGVADLRQASADLGVAIADRRLEADVAAAVAAWLTALGHRLGYDWSAVDVSPVALARAHAVVAARLAGVQHVDGANLLAASARALRLRLESHPGGDER